MNLFVRQHSVFASLPSREDYDAVALREVAHYTP